jgi:hypothetical protein
MRRIRRDRRRVEPQDRSLARDAVAQVDLPARDARAFARLPRVPAAAAPLVLAYRGGATWRTIASNALTALKQQGVVSAEAHGRVYSIAPSLSASQLQPTPTPPHPHA